MSSRTEYVVAVTGSAGPGETTDNPSTTIRDSLPERIERAGALPIRLLKYGFSFRNYIEDMDRIPSLWNQKLNVWDVDGDANDAVYVDAMVHMGMSKRQDWILEARARRDGYDWIGDDNVRLPSLNGGHGGRFEVLTPMFDVGALKTSLQMQHPHIPLAFSDDAGLKYCELQLYTSLATLHRRQEPARAVYYHVPADRKDRDGIANGVAVGTALITALVDDIAARETDTGPRRSKAESTECA